MGITVNPQISTLGMIFHICRKPLNIRICTSLSPPALPVPIANTFCPTTRSSELEQRLRGVKSGRGKDAAGAGAEEAAPQAEAAPA